MRRKLITKAVGVTFLSLFVFAVCTAFMISFFITENTKKHITDIVELIKEDVEISSLDNLTSELPSFLDENSEIRVSVFLLDGTPVFDSWHDADEMENHATRKEFIAAINGEKIFVTRHSTTVERQLLYYALRVENSNVASGFVILRVAVVVASINSYVNSSILILVLIVIVSTVVLNIFLNKMVNRILRPMNELKRSLSKVNKGIHEKVPLDELDEEMIPIIEEVNELSESIMLTMMQLTTEREKMNFILDNLEQGLIVVNNENKVILINKFSRDIFNVDEDIVGKNIWFLSQNTKINQAFTECLEKRTSTVFDLDVEDALNRVISASLTYINSPWIAKKNPEAAMMILTDITEIRNREKLRSDFFANASHELNTPLTYISGFSELMSQGHVKNEEKVIEIGNKILTESSRMKNLVKDMLELSTLESTKRITQEDIDLEKEIRNILDQYKRQASEKKIRLSLEGSASNFQSNKEMIIQMFSNLVDNAVKYNKENGQVLIKIEEKDDKVLVKISDTGIGIPIEEQSRVFERFYRVDKSRSKKIEGTGLGLSIVKHIAQLINAEIRMKSILNVGTEISVLLKNEK